MKLEVTSVRVAESGILEAISSPTADEHGEPAFEAKPAEHILPVDPGFTIDMFSCFRELKGQDMEFSHRADASLMGRPMPARQISSVPPKWKLNVDVFVFCDGHSAQRDPASWATAFIQEHFIRLLEPRMPRALPSAFSDPAGSFYAAAVRTALTETLETLNERFCEFRSHSGTTCTVALFTGALLTVANVGDSDAVLDSFSETATMTVAHRVNDNEAEKARLISSGAHISALDDNQKGPAPFGTADVGPLRVWPGGLCVSRSIGDKEVGPGIIATPHIRQILVPLKGCRLIVASDGVWDVINKRIVVQTCKGKTCREAANDVVRKVAELMTKKRGQLADDTSCMVIDCKPHAVATFKGYTPNQSVHRVSGSDATRQDSPDPSIHTHTNSGTAGVSVHGAYRLPGGVWSEQPALTTLVGGSSSDMPSSESSGKRYRRKNRKPAQSGGLFSCCFSGPNVKDRGDSTGELDAAFDTHSVAHSLGEFSVKSGGLRRMDTATSATAIGAASDVGGAPSDEGSSHHSLPSMLSEGSPQDRSPMRPMPSLASSLSFMPQRRFTKVPQVRFYADVDMLYSGDISLHTPQTSTPSRGHSRTPTLSAMSPMTSTPEELADHTAEHLHVVQL